MGFLFSLESSSCCRQVSDTSRASIDCGHFSMRERETLNLLPPTSNTIVFASGVGLVLSFIFVNRLESEFSYFALGNECFCFEEHWFGISVAFNPFYAKVFYCLYIIQWWLVCCLHLRTPWKKDGIETTSVNSNHHFSSLIVNQPVLISPATTNPFDK